MMPRTKGVLVIEMIIEMIMDMDMLLLFTTSFYQASEPRDITFVTVFRFTTFHHLHVNGLLNGRSDSVVYLRALTSSKLQAAR
jgi:hypothetical protein